MYLGMHNNIWKHEETFQLLGCGKQWTKGFGNSRRNPAQKTGGVRPVPQVQAACC